MEREVTVMNALGLHARPAAMIAKCASGYSSEIMLNKSGEITNCKSILGIMTLSAGKGTTLIISAEGDDAEDALNAIYNLFQTKFDEE
ncbi:MAG: HPr family phosphocarrier protein [Lentisphaeria bacterium]|nr:HPr family phosphocarrier protein [Lentisphaeria bacterium]